MATRMTCGFGRVALGLGLVTSLALTACSVDRELVHQNDFKCSGDSDCLVDYFCIGADGDVPGTCVRDPGTVQDCVDNDRDGFSVGIDCPPGPVDCNDMSNLVFPGAEEECNGDDDDCDGDTDEDVPLQACRLQLGVCAGAMSACVDGEYQDCAAEGLYGPDFEDVSDDEESCNGIDNSCDGRYPANATPEEIDDHCDCIPGITGPAECGEDVGLCQRGVRFCTDDGTFTECVEAVLGDVCVDDSTCGDNGYCIDENLDFREDLDDDCELTGAPDCNRMVCRTLLGATACDNDGACAADEACVEGACQVIVLGDVQEVCNGEDDDCNGRIDDPNICGACPFNTVFIDSVVPTVCVDSYEASRPDATETDAGTEERYAASRPDVLPWTGLDTDAAEAACRATAINSILGAGAVPQKFLCTGSALAAACGGDYPNGDTFVPDACNDGTVDDGTYTTGSFPECCIDFGGGDEVCDLSGNVAEQVFSPFLGMFGGHAESTDPDILDCDVEDILGVDESLLGFRCCAAPNTN